MNYVEFLVAIIDFDCPINKYDVVVPFAAFFHLHQY